jgi:hypothetical protein
LNLWRAQKLKSLKQCQERIMKLSLVGTAGYLQGAAGSPWPPVDTTLFQPIAFVKRLINKNAYWLLIAVGSMTALFLIVDPAAADPYKWCANYRNGGSNCGFTTFEQCQATVSGVGGFCGPNQFYTGPDKTSAQRSPRQAQRKPPAEYRTQEHRAQERRATDTPAPERRGAEDRFQ